MYRKIAKEHGVPVAEVKREMQAAIQYAYQKNDKSERETLMQEKIPCKGKVPTTEEVILHLSNQIKNRETK